MKNINSITKSFLSTVIVMWAFIMLTNVGKIQGQTLTVVVSHIDSVLCYGQSNGSIAVIASGGTSPYTYKWNTMPLQTTSTATNLPAGTYTVTVTDAATNTATASAIVSQPTPLSVNIDSTPPTCPCACNGQLTAIITGGTPFYNGYHYLWNTIPHDTTATITGLCEGTYNLTVTDSNGCQKIVSTYLGVEYDSMMSAFTASPLLGTVPCVVNFTYTGTVTNPISYQWDFGDGSISTEENPTHSYTCYDTYGVWLHVYFPCCRDSTFHIIGPNSTEELNNSFTLFPNPVKDIFLIQTAYQIKEIEITDISGKQIYTTSSTKFIDFFNYAKGIYFIKVTTDGWVRVKRFLKVL